MEKSAFYDLFCKIFAQNGLECYATREMSERFYDLTLLLTEANAKINLSAIREIPDIIAKHYADCLLAADFFPIGASVLDVGCGGGFPTLPLSIARPDLTVTGMDSTEKKVRFVRETAQKMGLLNVRTLVGRAETLAVTQMRASFDAVTSRAVSRLCILIELTFPFLKVDGRLVALKGAQGAEELMEARRGISKLGGEHVVLTEKTLRFGEMSEERCIITAKKTKPTPNEYPRAYATITKKPL